VNLSGTKHRKIIHHKIAQKLAISVRVTSHFCCLEIEWSMLFRWRATLKKLSIDMKTERLHLTFLIFHQVICNVHASRLSPSKFFAIAANFMVTLTGRRSVFVILLVLQHSILCSSIPLLSRVYDVAHVLQLPVDVPIRQQLHHCHVSICQAHFIHRHIFISIFLRDMHCPQFCCISGHFCFCCCDARLMLGNCRVGCGETLNCVNVALVLLTAPGPRMSVLRDV